MGAWNFASKASDDGTVEMRVNLTESDADGALAGTVAFRGLTYSVTGQWAAKGSVPGRNASICWFGGANNGAATCFLAAAGDLGTHSDIFCMDIAVTTASSGDGDDYGYNDRLYSYVVP